MASISEISVAEALAQAASVSNKAIFAISAADSPEFEPNLVDVSHMNMSPHHIHDLEGVFAQIFTALRPGGYFVANKFVGPRRFQWSDVRLNSVNALKVQRERAPAEGWITHDLTESVRFDEIIPHVEMAKAWELTDQVANLSLGLVA